MPADDSKNEQERTLQEPATTEAKSEMSMMSLITEIWNSESSSEKEQLIRELLQRLSLRVLASFIFGLFLLIAIAEIVVGSVNFHNCPVNNMIPIWLIVFGGVSSYMLHICFGIVDRTDGNLVGVRAFLLLFFCISSIIWVILGTYWTYSVRNIVIYDKQDGPTYCDHFTFVLAFAIITAIWVMFVIIVMLLVCCCCCICCIVLLEDDDD